MMQKKHECGKRSKQPRPKFFTNQRAIVTMELKGVNDAIDHEHHGVEAG